MGEKYFRGAAVMLRVLAFVEGQTEEQFVRKLVAEAFHAKQIYIKPTTPGRNRSRGGVQGWPRIKRELLRYLKEDNGRVLTTMFDYYALPADWPGKKDAARASHADKAQKIENAVALEIASEMGKDFDKQRFIPYIQMHEFEALLFSAPEILAEVIPGVKMQALQPITDNFSTPEEINDSPNSAPSKRLINLSKSYQKVLHGIIAAERIGLDMMRKKCPHFNEWLNNLEALVVQ